MKAVLMTLAVAAVAHAADDSTLIPSGISANCSSFLSTLNSDSTLSSCVEPLINTTASFSPTSGANLSSSDIDTTLASLCKSNAGCSDATIRTWLTSFYSACQPELTSSTGYNSEVRDLYDILYVVNPLKDAVCAINSANQDYCVNEILSSEKSSTSSSVSGSASASASASASSSDVDSDTDSDNVTSNSTYISFAVSSAFDPVALAADNLYITISSASSSLAKRALSYLAPRGSSQESFATIITPNATTYRTTNLPFLFLQPSMTNSQLCTPCTREIMVAYIKWESTVPYALGLSSSPILGSQGDLWTAINGTCGTAFVNAITSEVGSLASSSTVSGANSRFVMEIGTTVAGIALVAGAMAIFA